MTITAIILLILLGVFLFFVEFLLIPGITIAGIGGAILIIVGIYFGYHDYGTPVGHYILFGTAVGLIVTVYFSFRSRTWKSFMLNSKIEGKVSSDIEEEIEIGEIVETSTRLNPFGKVVINDKYYDAKSTGVYIGYKEKVEVVKITGSVIVVKPLK
ncbi:MAG: NfeD family protein [Bacteroidota bacterium]|nr:NfeD family protein [Bacteroidota bacterium]